MWGRLLGKLGFGSTSMGSVVGFVGEAAAKASRGLASVPQNGGELEDLKGHLTLLRSDTFEVLQWSERRHLFNATAYQWWKPKRRLGGQRGHMSETGSVRSGGTFSKRSSYQ